MAIADDTTIDYTNKIIDLIGTTVYDVSVLYSFCKEQFKLSTNIDDDFAWTANTPTDFTLKNGWYLRRHSIRRLKNGSITANYGTDEIEKISFSAIATDPIESDIGIDIRDDTVVIGELVDYDVDDSRMVWWVRTNGTVTSVTTGSTVDSLQGGTPSGTSTGTSENDTQDLWTNINTIGGLAATGPQPLMYVYTGDLSTGDFAGNARKNVGWDDDPDPALTNSDRGALDVLINIVDAGVTIGNPAGLITVYGRQGLDKFADFTIDISAGGRISVPIAQSNDGEDTIGEVAVCVDGRNASDFVAGEIITWATNQSAEVVEFIELAASTNGVLILRGLTEFPANNTAITGATSGGTGDTRGTIGGMLVRFDVETTPIDEADYGNLATGSISGHTGIVRSHITDTESGLGFSYFVMETRHDRLANTSDYLTPSDNDVYTGTTFDVTADFTGDPLETATNVIYSLAEQTVSSITNFDLRITDIEDQLGIFNELESTSDGSKKFKVKVRGDPNTSKREYDIDNENAPRKVTPV